MESLLQPQSRSSAEFQALNTVGTERRWGSLGLIGMDADDQREKRCIFK